MIFIGNRNQITGIRITPRMERTSKNVFPAAGILCNTHTTMSTSIQESMKNTIPITGSQYRRTKVIDRQEATGFGKIAG